MNSNLEEAEDRQTCCRHRASTMLDWPIGGSNQEVCRGLSLVGQPGLLILGEPTSSAPVWRERRREGWLCPPEGLQIPRWTRSFADTAWRSVEPRTLAPVRHRLPGTGLAREKEGIPLHPFTPDVGLAEGPGHFPIFKRAPPKDRSR